MGYCGVAPKLALVLQAHPNDTSDRIYFHVKGGLVLELFFQVCLKDGLGTFLGWPIFIFAPSSLGST